MDDLGNSEPLAKEALCASHGCHPAPRLRNERPLGIDRVKQLLRADGEFRLMETLYFYFRQTGNTIEHVLLGTPGFATVDPENIAALLTNNKEFGIGPRRNALQPLFGDGIFTQEGPDWKRSRDTIQRQLHHTQYRTLEVFRGAVDDLVHTMRKGGRNIDLQPLFFRMTLDATTHFLFGESVRSLVAAECSGKRRFDHAFDVVQKRATQRMRRYNLRLFGDGQRCQQACSNLTQIVDDILDRNLESTRGRKESTKYAFLDAIARDAPDRTTLRGQILNILAAGRDTTAALLSWTFFLLVRHPQVMQKLRTEVVVACGADPDLTRSKLKGMHYLQNVLRETLRLYPPVPVNFRTASKDTVIPIGGGPDRRSPVVIPKGKTVAFCPYFLHRRPDLYGMDAEIFRPERWDKDMQPLCNLSRTRWGYIPFGVGPRICPGMDFALTEAAYTVVRLLQEFETIRLPEGQPVELIGAEKQVINLVMSIRDGCRVWTE
ncbi:cytochrome P450 alkane hydroxylase [Phaeosphaeriaceae sp. PMI808]|nr:cytochrome P450 alkane hydroxylase [Phaeosphaeriaceae sp. PMI808]